MDVDVKKLDYKIMVDMCSHILLNDFNSKDRVLFEINHWSCMKLYVSEDIKFQCLHVTYHISLHGFKNGCLLVIFLDTIKLKSIKP